MLHLIALFIPMTAPPPALANMEYAYPIHIVYWIRSGGKLGHIVDGYIMSTTDDASVNDSYLPKETLLRYRRRQDGYEDEHEWLELTPKVDGTATDIEVVQPASP